MKKVFILDDNEDLLEIIDHVLSRDYEVVSKMDTENIVEEIQNYKPDLIILDHHVGDINSTDIMSRLKINDPKFSIPVVLFSAHPHLKDTAESMGAAGFIEKPSEISYIRSYIKNILSQ